jgi:hypothetical protein
LFVSTAALAQDLSLPDSALIVKNKIKTIRIYFNSPDGQKYQNRDLHYNRNGQLIREGVDSKSPYSVHAYDEQGRITSTTQRGSDGSFVSRRINDYGQKGNKITRYYGFGDSTLCTNVILFDDKSQKIREEVYTQNGIQWIYTTNYDSLGKVIATTDSSAATGTKKWYVNNKLTKKTVRDPKSRYFHQYAYTYDYFGRLWKMSDSTEGANTVTYTIVYSKEGGPREGIQRNGKMMDAAEEASFINSNPEFRKPIELEDDYGLPVPEMVEKHNLSYDKKGNIVRDELTQTNGSHSDTFVYTYEYEFY